MNQPPIIIGLAGTFAAGKDTLAHYLVDKRSFMHVSTGDILREETRQVYGTDDRPTLQKHGNELRAERGAGVLIDISIDRFKAEQQNFNGLVISGIRSIGEAEEVKKVGGILIFIDADPRVRYDRAYARQRDVEKNMTFEEFMASELKESAKPHHNKTDQNISGVKTLADHILNNAHSPEELYSQYEALRLGS